MTETVQSGRRERRDRVHSPQETSKFNEMHVKLMHTYTPIDIGAKIQFSNAKEREKTIPV